MISSWFSYCEKCGQWHPNGSECGMYLYSYPYMHGSISYANTATSSNSWQEIYSREIEYKENGKSRKICCVAKWNASENVVKVMSTYENKMDATAEYFVTEKEAKAWVKVYFDAEIENWLFESE